MSTPLRNSTPRANGTPALVRGRWYDGVHARPRPVLIGLVPGPRGPGLQLHPLAPDTPDTPDTLDTSGPNSTPSAPGKSGTSALPTPAPTAFAHEAVDWPELWSARGAPRTVQIGLGAAGSLEINDGAAWQAAWQAAGARPSLAQRMQSRWQVLATVLVLSLLGLAAFYRWGTPWAATQLAHFVPLSWEQNLSEEAMAELDGGFLQPSRLPPQRQAALQARFQALNAQWRAARESKTTGVAIAATAGTVATTTTDASAPGDAAPSLLSPYPGYAPPMQLALRSGMPANAFALPGGQIVMTDALVRAAERRQLDDDALIGVLAHEMGHVVHRHGTRLVIEQGVLNVGLGLALGDVSNLVATASTMLTSLAYRRHHEREADCFAVALMKRAGLPVAPMAELLLSLDDAGKSKTSQAAPPTAPEHADKTKGHSSDNSGSDWFSSHPDTARRAQAMRDGQGCDAP